MMHITCALLTGMTLAQSTGPPVILPTGALSRSDGRTYEFSMSTQINVTPPRPIARPWRMDLVANGPFSTLSREGFEIELNSPSGKILENGEKYMPSVSALGDAQLSVPIPATSRFPLTVTVRGTVACWRSTLDNTMAMRAEWPGSWPAPVRAMLSPSAMIESKSEIITATVETLTEGNVRSVPPLQAAKLLVQFACQNMQRSGARMLWGGQRQLRGINVMGAQAAAKEGKGSDADLVCICVAMLRAADLPARPVIGISGGKSGRRSEFITWAEVYIPSCGWVPFDPVELQKRTVGSLDPRSSWEWFGNFRELNERIPLSWTFAPGDGSTAFDAWALWGWDRLAPQSAFPPAIQKTAIHTPDGPIELGSLNAVPSQIMFTKSSKGRIQN